MSNSNTVNIRVGAENIPLTMTLSALEELGQAFSLSRLRDILTMIANPTPAQLVRMLIVFSRAAGFNGLDHKIAHEPVDLAEALSAMQRLMQSISSSELNGGKVYHD